MPPWRPREGFGTFHDEARLTRQELATLAAWANAGAPEGDPADRPPLPTFPEGWQLGKPDLVLTLPEPFLIPAGEDVYRAFVLPNPLPTDRGPLTNQEIRTKPEPFKPTRPRFPGLGTGGTLPGMP